MYAQEKGLTYVGESTGRQQYLYDVAYMRNSEVTDGRVLDRHRGRARACAWTTRSPRPSPTSTGKQIVASESYTSGPRRRPLAESSVQPQGRGRPGVLRRREPVRLPHLRAPAVPATGPGFTFSSWGLNFNRGNTWWEAADAWMDYLTRCNHLLRQGQQVAMCCGLSARMCRTASRGATN